MGLSLIHILKEWECEVISNKNVATFIKEFIVALPPGEHMDFVPGSYAPVSYTHLDVYKRQLRRWW